MEGGIGKSDLAYWREKAHAEPPKTITEFCCQVDAAAGDRTKLAELSNYIYTYGRQYSLVHLRFMCDHLDAAKAKEN